MSWGRKSPSPSVGFRDKIPAEGLGDEKLELFVNEYQNFDVLEEKKTMKRQKNTIIKNYGRLKGRGAGASPPP